jgi:hypothetical protein
MTPVVKWLSFGTFALLMILLVRNATVANPVFVTPDPIALTATHIVAEATKTQLGVATSEPNRAEVTLTAFHATRTAIAITREPELAISPTPSLLELTATQLRVELHDRVATAQSRSPTEIAQTATRVTLRATENALFTPTFQTGPLPTSTPTICGFAVGGYYQSVLSDQIQQALEATNLPLRYVSVLSVSLFKGGERRTEYYSVLETYFAIDIDVINLTDDQELIAATEKILNVLEDFPSSQEYGPHSPRLEIVFWSRTALQRMIDTGYNNALAAYAEGLRGEALIEALGGISPLL